MDEKSEISANSQTRFSFYEPETDSHSDAILKSLQAHEQERNEILGKSEDNPYQDAIRDALDLLRQHREEEAATPRANDDDAILQARSQDSEDDPKSKRKERQQRMQKYANRLQELKNDPEITSPAASTTSSNRDDVHKGVEKVLLAILDRASSRGRSVISASVDHEATSTAIPEDPVAKAVSELLKPSSFEDLSRINTQPDAPIMAQTSREDQDELDRVMQNLLISTKNEQETITEEHASLPTEDSFDRKVRDTLSPREAENIASNDEVSTRESESIRSQSDSSEEGSTDIASDEGPSQSFSRSQSAERTGTYSNESGERTGTYSNESGDSFDDEDDYDDEDDDDASVSDEEDSYPGSDESEEHADGLLGPLSKKSGGTTGVVLEEDSNGKKTHRKQQSSGHIFDSLTNAFSYVTGSASGSLDKYSTSEEDEEAEELVPSLCAHLLPTHIQPNSVKMEKRPKWNESNPDEPGYRVIRLNHRQIDAIDRVFQRMILQKSESVDSEQDADASFERDLKAAEELLDREEQKLKIAEKSLDNAEQSTILYDDGFDESLLEQKQLADFPGVKSIGKGEMGDLEYFHLPIIFKSHVTGFEPTKDLCLEPGNVVAGQYLVEGELGSAAFSTAYKCLDLNSEGDGPDGHEEVCLKVIKNTKDFFDQSLDEIKILELLRQTGACDQNCVVKMKTFFYHREHLIIVTELLRQNLFEFGKFIVENDEEPYFTINRLGYITRQCLIALRFVHSLGLVHSDVKPENILLGSYSRAKAKLIDFGSSCYLTDRQSSYIQSRSYRAPEVILGLPYDGRIDVWSIGCVVAEMFTGEVTFQNDSVVSMMSRIEAICGAFPRHMIEQGRNSKHFFTKCGLLFEKVGRSHSDEDETDRSYNDDGSDTDHKEDAYDVFQPKHTTLATRLGFSEEAIERFDIGLSLSKEQKRQAIFIDFVRKLLTVDPEKRPTAAEALEHPYMQYISTLTEDDILYPSS